MLFSLNSIDIPVRRCVNNISQGRDFHKHTYIISILEQIKNTNKNIQTRLKSKGFFSQTQLQAASYENKTAVIVFGNLGLLVTDTLPFNVHLE